MSGTDDGIKEFNNQIGTGVWSNPSLLPKLSELGVESNITTLYFGILVVPAWQLRQQKPIIL